VSAPPGDCHGSSCRHGGVSTPTTSRAGDAVVLLGNGDGSWVSPAGQSRSPVNIICYLHPRPQDPLLTCLLASSGLGSCAELESGRHCCSCTCSSSCCLVPLPALLKRLTCPPLPRSLQAGGAAVATVCAVIPGVPTNQVSTDICTTVHSPGQHCSACNTAISAHG
jgi:hypothetical protein